MHLLRSHPIVEYVLSDSSHFLAKLDAKSIGDLQYKHTVLTLQTSSYCNLGDEHPINHKDDKKKNFCPSNAKCRLSPKSEHLGNLPRKNCLFVVGGVVATRSEALGGVASAVIPDFEPLFLFFFAVSNSHPCHQFDLAKCLLTNSTSSSACAFLTPLLPHARTMLSREPPHVLIVK